MKRSDNLPGHLRKRHGKDRQWIENYISERKRWKKHRNKVEQPNNDHDFDAISGTEDASLS